MSNPSFQQTVPHPKTRPVATARPPRQLTRFEIWAWSPIISFQVGLTAGYAALIYFGVSALIANPPSFAEFSPAGYVGFWAVALILGSILATLGSVSRATPFYWIELVGSSLLTLTVGSYAALLLWIAYGTSDIDRVAGGAGFVALAVPIIIRTMWLYSQLLRK